MSDLDLSAAVEAAARDHYDRERVNLVTGERCGPEWDDVYPENLHAWREDALPHVAAAAPLIAAQVRAQVAAAVEARQIICPIHHMPDCSPLLNGCSLPIHLHEQREIDATLVRGESA